MTHSEITVKEALEKVNCWLPTQIWIDGKKTWDDDLSIDEGWMYYDEFIDNMDTDLYYSIVSSVEVEIVDFHHAVVHIYLAAKN